MSIKKLIFIFSFSFLFWSCTKPSFKQTNSEEQEEIQNTDNSFEEISSYAPARPSLLSIFEQSYPDILFKSEFDSEVNDFKITMTLDNKETIFYWNNGSMLPEQELENKEKYWTLLYNYNYNQPLLDPADYTEEQIEALKKFSSTDNRKNGAGTPMFFFDAVYDSYTKADLEKHIKQIKFLDFKVNIHQRLEEPLSKVEKRIMAAAETDPEVKNFVKNISKNEGYYWRLIANTNRKSFHSLGIAIDIQPKSYKGKEVYWSWAKDRNPEGWMFTPLKDRWMPPQTVIDIFEDEGFIWGGKWAIWDNMHFEYHPELINTAKAKKNVYN